MGVSSRPRWYHTLEHFWQSPLYCDTGIKQKHATVWQYMWITPMTILPSTSSESTQHLYEEISTVHSPNSAEFQLTSCKALPPLCVLPWGDANKDERVVCAATRLSVGFPQRRNIKRSWMQINRGQHSFTVCYLEARHCIAGACGSFMYHCWPC